MMMMMGTSFGELYEVQSMAEDTVRDLLLLGFQSGRVRGSDDLDCGGTEGSLDRWKTATDQGEKGKRGWKTQVG